MKRSERKKLERNLIFRIEFFLKYVILIFFFMIFFIQFFQFDSNFGMYLNSIYKLEGVRVEDYFNIFSSGWVVIEASNRSQAEILVNGETMGNFENGVVKVFVRNSDVLEINSTMEKRPLYYKVIETSKNIKSPKINYTITTNGNVEILGRVEFK